MTRFTDYRKAVALSIFSKVLREMPELDIVGYEHMR